MHISAVVEQDSATLGFRIALLGVVQVVSLISFTVHSFVFILGTLVQLLSHQTTFLGGVVSVDIVWLHLREIELLWAKDGAWSSDSNPAYETFCRDLEMLHSPKSYKSTSSTKSSFAMNSDSTMVWLLKMLLDNIEEVSDNLVWGCGSINKEEVVMSNSSVGQMLFIILFFVESDHSGYIDAFKDISILVWMVSISLTLVSVLDWSHEGDELAWDDPVEVSILNSLIVLVLLDIKCPEVIPSKSYGILESLKAMK